MAVPVNKATFVVKLGGNTDIFVPRAGVVVFFFYQESKISQK
jgi:hypothetical protein